MKYMLIHCIDESRERDPDTPRADVKCHDASAEWAGRVFLV